ncbi:MAG: aminotransferase class IV [Bacteroidetes bacterium]|nr:aminotransferase class IV [Bacteroidota bacterium]
MATLCLNGKFLPADEPVLLASNRGYRYGDGLFETMRMIKGQLPWWDAHWARLQKGLQLLQYELPGLFNAEKLKQDIITLCRKNKCEQLARIRLSVFRGNGGLYDGDQTAQYLVECWPLPASRLQLNINGLVVGVYPHSRKSCDLFSPLKTANFLPYTMAAQFAKQEKMNDCLVLNNYGRIADSTIANLFIIKNNNIITPALTEGGVEGTARNYLLRVLPEAGYSVQEGVVTPDDLLQAEEVFLTNAIHGIRWVGRYGDRHYTNTMVSEIYARFFQTIPG